MRFAAYFTIYVNLLLLEAQFNRRADRPAPAKVTTRLGGPGMIQVQHGHSDGMPKEGDTYINHAGPDHFEQEFSHPKKIQAWVTPRSGHPAELSATGHKTDAAVFGQAPGTVGEIMSFGKKGKYTNLGTIRREGVQKHRRLYAKSLAESPSRVKAWLRGEGGLYAGASNYPLVSSSSGSSSDGALKSSSSKSEASVSKGDSSLFDEISSLPGSRSTSPARKTSASSSPRSTNRTR